MHRTVHKLGFHSTLFITCVANKSCAVQPLGLRFTNNLFSSGPQLIPDNGNLFNSLLLQLRKSTRLCVH